MFFNSCYIPQDQIKYQAYSFMKAIICEAPQKLVMKDMDIPEVRNEEVLVKIRRIGICGTDLHAYEGNQPFFSYPRILGHELAVEIVEDSGGWKSGEQVVVVPYWVQGEDQAVRRNKANCSKHLQVIGVHVDGGMREYMTIPPELLLKADGIQLEQMAIVECMGIGAHAVRRANITAGDKVLVIGAGPIGVGLIQFAQIAGGEVIVMDLSEKRLAYCQTHLNVTHTINPGTIQSVEQALKDRTAGELPYIVFDATGNRFSMESAFSYVAHGGTLIFVGLIKGEIQFYNPMFHKKELSLLSSRNATIEDLNYVISCMRAGKLETEVFITHKVPFLEAMDSFPQWISKDSGVMKAMLTLD